MDGNGSEMSSVQSKRLHDITPLLETFLVLGGFSFREILGSLFWDSKQK